MRITKKTGPYLVFFAAMLWATDAPFRLYLTKGLSSNFIVLAEHTVDILVLLPILIAGFAGIKKLSWKGWLAALAIGIGGSALASVAYTQAFHYLNPSVAILLQKLQPLIAIALAAALLKEQLGKKFWLWAVVAIAGAYLISFPDLNPQVSFGGGLNPNLLGVGLALFAALLWGASTVLGKYVLREIDFRLMTGLRFAFGFLFLLLLNFWQRSFPAPGQFSPKDALFILIIAVASGVVSLLIYYKGLAYTKASVATIAELGFPMAAVVVNWIFLSAMLAPMQIAGIAVLLFAVFKLTGSNAKADATDAELVPIAAGGVEVAG
ncbi:MAG: DMT family transporter [Minisyncoccia bacterium]